MATKERFTKTIAKLSFGLFANVLRFRPAVRRSATIAAIALGVLLAGCQAFFALNLHLDNTQYAHGAGTLQMIH